MVAFNEVIASNDRIASALPARLVAVFVGGTSGIGEYTVKAFVRRVSEPRLYLLGRSQEAADRIISECKVINPKGEYFFLKVDASLIRSVDEVSKEIVAREKYVNLVVLSTGTLKSGTKTSEGLHTLMTLQHYSRIRFILNLLPLLRAAPHLRRVISILAGTKEGPIIHSDYPAYNIPLMKARGHMVSMHTLALEELHARAPEVSFVHSYPGAVKTNIGRDLTGVVGYVLTGVFTVLGPFICISSEESGERHLFLGTSGVYPAKSDASVAGIPVEGGEKVARGTDGVEGSGVYSVDWDGSSAKEGVQQVLEGLRRDGSKEKVWEHLSGEFVRITGSESMKN
ncbi:hypothetical protein HDV00_007820 [Rhizophlyctis rosea]|nr:hypothetical protein HDV00_007820 [Rhizophlyctis rosea]